MVNFDELKNGDRIFYFLEYTFEERYAFVGKNPDCDMEYIFTILNCEISRIRYLKKKHEVDCFSSLNDFIEDYKSKKMKELEQKLEELKEKYLKIMNEEVEK
jgi:hypothetical protein